MSKRNLDLDEYTFDVLSVDIFDTLLLRCRQSEIRRFRQLAAIQSERLKALGLDIDMKSIFISRLEVQNLVYRGLEMYRPQGDVHSSQIYGLQCSLLGIEQGAAAALCNAELDIEVRTLRPNDALLGAINAAKQNGKRIIAVSDTYLSADVIGDLVERVVGFNPLNRIYTSSDERATKHSGVLFDVVTEAEAVEPARMLHCGDNPRSDGTMARDRGLQAVVLPRPRSVRISRRLDRTFVALTMAPWR